VANGILKISRFELEDAIKLKHLRPTIPEDTPHAFSYLTEFCWKGDPDERPLAAGS
jgi:hypothetical protein